MPGLASSIRAVFAVALVTISAACTTAEPASDTSARTAHGAAAGQARHKAPISSYPVIYLGSMAGEWAFAISQA